jgi:Fur family ferric uptake transcriptional regulator
MTVSRASAPLPVASVEDAVGAIRARGLRLSAARRVVLEALFAADGPVSAEQIAHGLGGRLPAPDLASVYRNLETLEELGIVRHVHLGHRAGLYTLAARAEREYVVCERCGAAIAVEPRDLDEARLAIRQATGYEASFSHFPIVGLCARCAGGTAGTVGENADPRRH